MAVIIEASYSKKLGLPQYSSHQYAVTVRLELADLSQLEATNTRLYAQLQQAVDTQIQQTGLTPAGPTTTTLNGTNGTGATSANAADAPWNCTPKQRDLILRIIEEHGLDKHGIESLAHERFGAGVRQLNRMQASGLIDELFETHGGATGSGNGRGPRRGPSPSRRDPAMIAALPTPEPEPIDVPIDPLEYVSPSRLKSYLTCPLRFYFEKVARLPSPVSPALHLGRAVHSALQAYNKARWREQDCSEPAILAAYRDAFLLEEPDQPVAWETAEKRTETEVRGAAIVSAFLASGVHPPGEKPAGVEVRLDAIREDLPLPLLGIVDLVKADGTPVDYKTVATTPDLTLESWLHELQLVAYALLVEDATGLPIPGCELVFLVKTKTPKVIVHRLAPPDEIQRARFRSLVMHYTVGLTRSDYHPARDALRLVPVSAAVLGLEGRFLMSGPLNRIARLITEVALLAGVVTMIAACAGPQRATVDAPDLASALRWVGTCGVLCSALAGTALVLASRNRRK